MTPGNLIEANAAFEKCSYSDFISRIERHSLRSSCLRGLIGETKTRKFTHVWGAEVEMTQVTNRKTHIRWDTFGVGQSVKDGQAHIGHRKLSKYAAIDELDHGMNGRLGMDDHFHFSYPNVKQPASLDYLKALIHQCG